MRIAVIPAGRNNGNTTLSMLIGLELSSQRKTTCLAHVNKTSEAFHKYLNLKQFTDKTSTPSQIVNILKSGDLTGDDVRSYCRGITNDLEAFTNESEEFTEQDMAFMHKCIALRFPHEHIIFDIDDMSDDNKITTITRLCDVVVICVNQSIKELDWIKENKQRLGRITQNKPVLFVVNNFNSNIMSLKDMAKYLGMKKTTSLVVLHRNAWIAWATAHGKLDVLFNNIKKKDKRVIDINADISKICETIVKIRQSQLRSK